MASSRSPGAAAPLAGILSAVAALPTQAVAATEDRTAIIYDREDPLPPFEVFTSRPRRLFVVPVARSTAVATLLETPRLAAVTARAAGRGGAGRVAARAGHTVDTLPIPCRRRCPASTVDLSGETMTVRATTEQLTTGELVAAVAAGELDYAGEVGGPPWVAIWQSASSRR